MADLTPTSEALTGRSDDGMPASSLPAILQAPTQRVGPLFQALLSLANIIIWAAIIPVYTVLLPTQIAEFDPGNKVSTLSIILLIGGIGGLVSPPLAGALSDRTTSRWGRRRPWILGCAFGSAIGLLLVALAQNLTVLTIGFIIYSIMINMTLSPLLATIPDKVPVQQRATVSAFVGLAQPVGTLIGIIAIAQIRSTTTSYFVLIVGLLVVMLLFTLAVRELVLQKGDLPPFSLAAFLSNFLINPLKHRDFGYVWIARVLAILSQTLLLTFLLYFLNDVVHYDRLFPGQTGDQGVAAFQGIYTILLIVATVVGGIISDRLQKRKVFVIAGNLLMAISAFVLALVPTWPVALVVAAVYGLGFGLYISSDVALATQVLPDAQSRGKDLGLITAANLVPQLLIPVVSAIAFGLFHSYAALFIIISLTALFAAVFIVPIKSVR